MSALITFDDLTLGYDRHPAVHHLTGTVSSGSLLAMVGPNGAGKSTLLKGIAGMMRPLSGAITIAEEARGRIAYLPQQPMIDRSFPISVHDFVAMGLWRRAGLFGRIAGTRRERIMTALGAVGLAGFERRAIGTLSGGQMQRMLFARVMAQDAPLILLDEPFAAIDEASAEQLGTIIARWHGEGRTVIAVLHDIERVRARFPETLILAREKVAWGPTADVLGRLEHLSRAREMMEAWDEHAAVCAREAA